MTFLLTWQVPAEGRIALLEQFIAAQDQRLEDATVLGRWHYTDGSGGIMVIESRSVQPVARFIQQWNGLLFGELVPVVSDAGLSAILSKLRDGNERKPVQAAGFVMSWQRASA